MKAVSGALLLVILCGLLLAGCGQKGPLYLPGEAPESQTDGPFGLDNDQGSAAEDDTADSSDDDSAESPAAETR